MNIRLDHNLKCYVTIHQCEAVRILKVVMDSAWATECQYLLWQEMLNELKLGINSNNHPILHMKYHIYY